MNNNNKFESVAELEAKRTDGPWTRCEEKDKPLGFWYRRAFRNVIGLLVWVRRVPVLDDITAPLSRTVQDEAWTPPVLSILDALTISPPATQSEPEPTFQSGGGSSGGGGATGSWDAPDSSSSSSCDTSCDTSSSSSDSSSNSSSDSSSCDCGSSSSDT